MTTKFVYCSFRYIIGLAGPPGAGKSTVADEITKRVNRMWLERKDQSDVEIAVSLPMDGFHLYRSQLDMMEVL
jgi:pantothenate kinase